MSDHIGDLVDWQIAQRKPHETIHHICRVCLSAWTGEPNVCPECGVTQ